MLSQNSYELTDKKLQIAQSVSDKFLKSTKTLAQSYGTGKLARNIGGDMTGSETKQYKVSYDLAKLSQRKS